MDFSACLRENVRIYKIYKTCSQFRALYALTCILPFRSNKIQCHSSKNVYLQLAHLFISTVLPFLYYLCHKLQELMLQKYEIQTLLDIPCLYPMLLSSNIIGGGKFNTKYAMQFIFPSVTGTKCDIPICGI